ncbi:MAG: type VI secretion system tip protein VgrG [Salibacteraceae bacterium]|nr:type VI secretion system tip protein VgrG [Salibacteraceae bacterium]
MAKSPLDNAVDRLSFSILVNGAEIESTIQISSISISKEINSIPVARIYINDGDPAKGEFTASENANFKPGQSIKIKLGYESTEEVAFDGIITAQSLKVSNYSHKSISQLVLTCHDKAFKMTLVKKSLNFAKKKDSEIISSVISSAGLTSGTVTATTFQHPNLIQYNVSDWDFILDRAAANGYVVTCEAGSISAKKPESSGTEVLILDYGANIIDFKADLDTRTQIKTAKYNSWDSALHKYATGTGTAITGTGQGSVTADDLATAGGNPAFILNSSTPEDQSVLKVMADAELAKSRYSRIKGEVTSFGTNLGEIGSFIKFEGFGTLFNGLTFITSVNHEVKAGIWKTTLGFGFDYKPYKPTNPLDSAKSAANNTAITGLHIGKVKKIDADPLGEFRVQVVIPIIEETGEGIWARLSHLYASNGSGFFFYPEIDDEVVVGFLENDPRFAIIVGSMYSKKNVPASTPAAENFTKEFVSKTNMKLSFDEEKKVIQIETPGGQKITLSDEDKGIKLTDQNSNSITMDDSGIVIESSKDLTLNSKGKITLSATGNLAATSKGDLSLEGNNVSSKAKIALKAEGAASAEIKASGSVIVKGAIVKIN